MSERCCGRRALLEKPVICSSLDAHHMGRQVICCSLMATPGEQSGVLEWTTPPDSGGSSILSRARRKLGLLTTVFTKRQPELPRANSFGNASALPHPLELLWEGSAMARVPSSFYFGNEQFLSSMGSTHHEMDDGFPPASKFYPRCARSHPSDPARSVAGP